MSSCRKNSAPLPSTVEITRARSRKSLCCSHDVSAINRQPWQAARAGIGFVLVLGCVLGTDGVVGAETSEVDRRFEMPGTCGRPGPARPSCLRHRRFRYRAGCHRLGARVDSLPDRAGRVAAFERDRGDELVRQRMEQDVGKAEELAFALVVVRFPAVETRVELLSRVSPRVFPSRR